MSLSPSFSSSSRLERSKLTSLSSLCVSFSQDPRRLAGVHRGPRVGSDRTPRDRPRTSSPSIGSSSFVPFFSSPQNHLPPSDPFVLPSLSPLRLRSQSSPPKSPVVPRSSLCFRPIPSLRSLSLASFVRSFFLGVAYPFPSPFLFVPSPPLSRIHPIPKGNQTHLSLSLFIPHSPAFSNPTQPSSPFPSPFSHNESLLSLLCSFLSLVVPTPSSSPLFLFETYNDPFSLPRSLSFSLFSLLPPLSFSFVRFLSFHALLTIYDRTGPLAYAFLGS